VFGRSAYYNDDTGFFSRYIYGNSTFGDNVFGGYPIITTWLNV
jgi:hypothetical protein